MVLVVAQVGILVVASFVLMAEFVLMYMHICVLKHTCICQMGVRRVDCKNWGWGQIDDKCD